MLDQGRGVPAFPAFMQDHPRQLNPRPPSSHRDRIPLDRLLLRVLPASAGARCRLRRAGGAGGHCEEVGAGGVFQRRRTGAEMEVDCNAWTGTIRMTDGPHAGQVLSSG